MLCLYNHIDILNAYAQGFFQTLDQNKNFFFYCPESRPLIPIEGMHVSKTLSQKLKKNMFTVKFNTAFIDTMKLCIRNTDNWITPELVHVYNHLHRLGYAHSVECWNGDLLVGGLYGLAIGAGFFVESMFSKENDASKVALFYLIQELQKQGFQFIDCQIMSTHLKSLGAVDVNQETFSHMLSKAIITKTKWGQEINQVAKLYEFNIETDRLLIRQVNHSDEAAVLNLAKNSKMHRYTLVPPLGTASDFQSFLMKMREQNSKGIPDGLSIINKDDGKYIGSLSMFYPNRFLPAMELAVEINPNFWGKGYGSEAFLAGISFLSDSYPIYRLQARAVPENISSNALMRRLHFHFEGTLKNMYWFDGLFDLNFYSLTRSELGIPLNK